MYEVYSADEAFVTGTFGGLTPVAEIDGRNIGENLAENYGQEWDKSMGPMTRHLNLNLILTLTLNLSSDTRKLRGLYKDLVEIECPPID